MIIPPQVTQALDDLLIRKLISNTPNGAYKTSVFASRKGHWGGLIEESNGARWFVVPIPNASRADGETHSEWSCNEIQSLKLYDRLCAFASNCEELVAKESVQALERGHLSALCLRCDLLDLVAAILDEHGTPPKTVAEDWQHQLTDLNLSASETSPATTLCSKEGILFPIATALGLEVALNETSPVPVKVVDWPWKTASAEDNRSIPTPESTQSGLAWTTPSVATTKTKSSASKKNKQTNALLMPILAIAAIVCVVWLGWFFYPRTTDSSASKTISSIPDAINSTVSPTRTENSLIQSNQGATSEAGPDADTPGEELTLTESPTMSLEPTTDPSSADSIESLLAELQPKGAKTFSLDGTSSTSIISQALKATTSDESLQQDGATGSNESSADEPTEEQVPAPAPDSQTDTNDAATSPLALEKVLTLAAASKRESIPVGQRVASKDGECQVHLKLAEGLVVEPSESVTINGVGKSVWKIAIEDEEPELLLEIASKPGARWQIVTTVALRETSTSLPVLFGPADALTVGNQLLEYNHWISNSISTLQSARSIPRRRSRIDFAGEIQKLERQQKEVERALQRWQIVAKLSHLLYDSNEIHIKLSASPTPPKSSPESVPQ